jgi:hypothetical protein
MLKFAIGMSVCLSALDRLHGLHACLERGGLCGNRNVERNHNRYLRGAEGVSVMVKGRPWTVQEEKQLGKLVEARDPH